MQQGRAFEGSYFGGDNHNCGDSDGGNSGLFSVIFVRCWIQKGKMTMYKAIPTFILLFTGCLHTNMHVAAETPLPDISFSTFKTTEDPEGETPRHESYPIPEERLSSLIVAGISMTVVLLFILVIIAACYAWKKSKGSLVGNNPDPSSEPGVSLRDFQHLKTNTSSLLEEHHADSGRAVA